MQPPRLDMKDETGKWRTVIEDVGFPVGRPQTIAVDLTGKFPGRSREVRIVTNMRDLLGPGAGRHLARPGAGEADAGESDRSARYARADSRPRPVPMAGRRLPTITRGSAWLAMEGPGRALHAIRGRAAAAPARPTTCSRLPLPATRSTLTFDAAALPPLQPGFDAHVPSLCGRFQQGDEHPLGDPRRGCAAAVPRDAELSVRRRTSRYPDTPEHRDYLARYNTRIVTAPVPSLELSAALALDHSSQR